MPRPGGAFPSWQRSMVTPTARRSSLLIISTVFRDEFAKRLRYIAAGGIGTACVVALLAGPRFGLPVESVGGYVGGMTVLAFAYGLQLRFWPFIAIGILNCAGGLASIGLWIVRFIRDLSIPDEVKPLLWAMANASRNDR